MWHTELVVSQMGFEVIDTTRVSEDITIMMYGQWTVTVFESSVRYAIYFS